MHCGTGVFVMIVLIQLAILITFMYLGYLRLKESAGCINLTSFSLHILRKVIIHFMFLMTKETVFGTMILHWNH